MAKCKEWIRSAWQQMRSAWRTFLQALPLLLFWLSIPAVALCIGALWQASTPARELSGRSPVVAKQKVLDPADGPLFLEVAHPRRLFLQPYDEAAAPLTVRLLRATPTPGPTVTATATPTSTPTTTLPYVVSFASSQGLSFSDKDGNPLHPEIALTPAPFPVAPAVLYIRPAQQPKASLPSSAQLDAYVRGPDGGLNATPMRTQVTLESARESTLRRFGDLLTGTTALIITLTSALVGFGVQQWRQMTEREQKQQEEQQSAALQRIERLGELDLSERACCYLEYRSRRDRGWVLQEVRERLGEKWRDVAPHQLQLTVDLIAASQPERRDLVEEKGFEQVQNTLLWSWRRLDKDWQRRIVSFWQSMTPDYPFEFPEQSLWIWRRTLRMWTDLALWSPFEPRVGMEVEQGLDVLGLSTSPFGPGIAEEDTMPAHRRVTPPVMEYLEEQGSALVVGSSGTGKTATALLFVLNALRERDTFPVYWRLPSRDLRSIQLDDVAQIIARSLLFYVSSAPTALLEHEIEGKAAIAHLLNRYLNAGPGLTLLFHQAGLPQRGTGGQVLKEIEKLTCDASLDTPIGESELLMLLEKACPYGFPHTTLLLDMQGDRDEEAACAGAALETLIDLTTVLERRGVLVKAFLPTEVFEESLERWEAKWMRIPLKWSDEELHQMLINRLAHFEYETLAAWCTPWDVDQELDWRVVEQANGSPRRLIELGNALLRRIGQTGQRLTQKDVEKALKEGG